MQKCCKGCLDERCGHALDWPANGIDEQELQDEQTTEQEQVDDKTGTDGDELIIETAQKMRTVVLAATSAAGGRVVDGKPEPGMATVYAGVTACFLSIINLRRWR